MMSLSLKIFFLCICILPVSFFAQTKPAEKFPKVPTMGSEMRTLKSADTGREYDLYIHLPSAPVAGKKYPVIFVLDGQWDFKLMDSVYGGLYYDRFVPEMIIVGITYSGENLITVHCGRWT